MKLIELTDVKGGLVLVNAAQVLHVSAAGASSEGSSMYGNNNIRTSSRLLFAQGVSLEVKESLSDIVALFGQ